MNFLRVLCIVSLFLALNACSSGSSSQTDVPVTNDTDAAVVSDVTDAADSAADADTAADELLTDTDEPAGTDADTVKTWDNHTFSEAKLDACSGKIAYQKWEYKGTAEAVVVFANGRTEYTDKYHHLINTIKKPWHIVMYDHFGQGRSEGTRAHADDVDAQFVCDLKKIVDEAAPQGLPVAIMAHSMGGFVVTRFAELYPDAAKVYALSSPMYAMKLPYPESVVRSMAEQNVKDGKGAVESQPADPRPDCDKNEVTHDCELYNAFKDDPLTIIGNPTWGWFDAVFKGQDKLFADAAKVTKPLLVMIAGNETVVLPEKEQAFCDAVNAATPELCKTATFANDYHELFNETDRADVLTQAVTFIEEGLKK